MVTRIVGGLGEINYLPLPEDDPKQRNPDITRAKSLLGWEPSVNLETGLEKTAAWMARALNA
jgi:nucleoside-diphosphate-sugar epimerase